MLPYLPAALALACAPAAAQTAIVYAHRDGACVQQASAIAAAWGPVLIDTAVEPGSRWRPTIAAMLLSAQTVLIFWSASAAASPEVAAEWRIALAGPARVVPVLLDNTPLPPDLAALQAIGWQACNNQGPTR